jgi:predicted nucleotide-binding protein
MKRAEGIRLKKSRVFVVNGRNEELRRAMFNFLRALAIKPIEWNQAIALTGKASPFISEILDSAFGHAQAIVVMFTGDDEARLRAEFQSGDDEPYEKILAFQPRPNVIFEAGLALGRNPDRTILVEIGHIKPFSDIGGRHILHLDNSVQRRQDFAQRLLTAGCKLDLTGTDWHTAGNFANSRLARRLRPGRKDPRRL